MWDISTITLWNKWCEGRTKLLFGKGKFGKNSGSYPHFSARIPSKDWFYKNQALFTPQGTKDHKFELLLLFWKKTIKVVDRPDKKSRTRGKFKKVVTKERPIMYADHIDTEIYSWYAYQIANKYEEILKKFGLEDQIAAYRSRESKKVTNITTAKEVLKFLEGKASQGAWKVKLFDVKKFYDTLDPKRLKDVWKSVLGVGELDAGHYAVYMAVTRYGVIDKGALMKYLNDNFGPRMIKGRLCSSEELYLVRKESGLKKSKTGFLRENKLRIDPLEPENFLQLVNAVEGVTNDRCFGIPQGLPISPVLANIYMLDFDKIINDFVVSHGGIYRRYADDIVIVIPEKLDETTEDAVKASIQKVGLTIQDQKTETYLVDNMGKLKNLKANANNNAMTYLGVTYDGNRPTIRNATIAKAHIKIRRALKAAKRYKHRYFNPTDKGKLTKVKKVPLSKEQLTAKVMRAGTFRYIDHARSEFGPHISHQFSRKKVKKMLSAFLKNY